MRIYTWIIRFCLLFGSIILSLVLGEIYLRTNKPMDGYLLMENIYQVRHDSELYEPKPDVWVFNHDGIADSRNFPLEKPRDTFRIEVIGDSLTFGLGLNPEDKYSHQLERKLNASGSGNKTYEVLNLGVSGYNISQIITRLSEKGLKYHPDMVIYHLWLDDIYISDPGYASAANNPIFRFISDTGGIESHKKIAKLLTWFFNLQLGRRFLYYIETTTTQSLDYSNAHQERYQEKMTPQIASLHEQYKADYAAGAFKDMPWSEPYFKSFADDDNFLYWNYYLSEFSTICRTQNISCIILLTPVLYTHKQGTYNWAPLNTFIQKMAAYYGLTVLDETEDFEHYNGVDLRNGKTDPEHPNALGDTLIADGLYRLISQ